MCTLHCDLKKNNLLLVHIRLQENKDRRTCDCNTRRKDCSRCDSYILSEYIPSKIQKQEQTSTINKRNATIEQWKNNYVFQ